jgi:hypothetical protein
MEARWLLAEKESAEEMLNQVNHLVARPSAAKHEQPRGKDAERKPS